MHSSKLTLGPSPTVAHFLRPSSIEGHPIYYGSKSNAFIRQAFQRDDQVEREKGWKMPEGGREGEGRGEKKVRLWKGKKKEDETSRCRRMACYDRVLFLGYESYQKRATRSPSARQGVARTLDHYRHCPLMDIYECTNQRHYYRASMQSESII